MLACSVLCKELETRGLSVTKKNLNLDSDKVEDQIFGIVIKTDDINKEIMFPVDSVLEAAPSISEAAEFIQAALNESKLPDGVDYNYFLSKDYILSHVQLGLTEKLWQPFLYRDSVFSGINEYCYIAGIFRKNRWMVEIREDLIKDLGISIDDLWSAAKINTFKNGFEFVLKSVSEILGVQGKGLIENSSAQYLFSVSNHLGLQGAVQILNPKVLDLLEKYSTEKLVIYPQSENNFLVAPVLTGVIEIMKSVAENDTNYRYLTEKLFVIDKSFNVVDVIDFIPAGERRVIV